MTEMPLIISTDDHLVEPPNLWTDRLPAKYKEIGPHIELHGVSGDPRIVGGSYIEAPGELGDPVAWWCYEDQRFSLKRYIAAAGFPRDEIGTYSINFSDMRDGCWKPESRLADMDLNHVEASLCFPNYPRFCGQIFLGGKDKALARLCVEAYNDWMVDEWCAGSGGRLIPLCLVPLWDPELAAAEVRRNAARGVHAVAFSECPPWLGLPSIHSGYWEPFFNACDETQTVICMHIGSGTKTFLTSDDAPEAIGATGIFTNSVMSMIDWLFSGVLMKHPDLKLFYAECQIGWIPYVIERVDDVWKTHGGWAMKGVELKEPPSHYYYRQVYSCFFKDEVGVQMLDQVGPDNVCFEVDYPHQDGTWPNTRQVALDTFGHLPAEQIYKIARGNAIDLFRLNFS